MLIKALCDYHDIKQSKNSGDSKFSDYFSRQKVQYMIFLTSDGEISDIADIRQSREIKLKNDKLKTVYDAREITLPKRSQKPGIDLNIIEHRPYYIFGIAGNKSGESADDRAKRVNRAQKSHAVFIEGNLEFCQQLESDIAKAYVAFLKRWSAEEQAENTHILQLGNDYESSYYCFALDGRPDIMLHEDEQLIEKYIQHMQQTELSADEKIQAMCPIEGRILPIARIHEKIKGLRGGNTTGGVLVGVKESAFESYGKTQSYNSSVSEVAMKKYTKTLNDMLADSRHSRAIGDFTMVHFAVDKDDEKACDVVSLMLHGQGDEELESALSAIVAEMSQGRTGDLSVLGIREEMPFYVVGLSPNSSRISQKFIIRDSFGGIMRNIIQHQLDFNVRSDARQVHLYRILETLISPKSKNETVPPPLISATVMSILNGTNYPTALLETVVRRVKTDSDEEKNRFIKINDVRIGIIKASLNRKARFLNKEEDITMALDDTNKNQAYLCGRLFAVLEKIQQDSSKSKLNRTIKDAYFASACVKPATVFPKLIMLSQNHLSKLDRPGYLSRLIGEISGLLEGEFPQTLTLDEQGRFIIGYYHQNNALYTKRTDITETEEE